jgi:dipeptidyl aminopeptidase/acylaminoacyl peptidase
VKSITYKAGTENVPAILVSPSGGAAKCCVLYAPDGHTAAEATRLGFLIKAMGESGYTVLVTQYRSDVADVTDDDDLKAGLDYLGTLPGGEAARLSLVGHGRGGMAALRVASRDKRVRGVVSLSAPSNLTRLLKGLRAYSPAAADFQASRIAPTASSRALSPAYFASAVKVPVFIIHGSLDLMVPPEHALWNAMDLLATGNNQVEMYLAPWDIHYYDSTFAFLKPEQWVARVTTWLDKVGATTSH